MKRGGPILFSLAVAAAMAGAAPACSNAAKLAGEGGECTQATDCQSGLVCIQGKCSSDLSQIQSTEDSGGGTDAAAKDSAPKGDAAAGDATTQDSGSAQDSGGPQDSGAPQDTGAPKDTGSPPQDSGSGGEAATD